MKEEAFKGGELREKQTLTASASGQTDRHQAVCVRVIFALLASTLYYTFVRQTLFKRRTIHVDILILLRESRMEPPQNGRTL